VESEPTAYALSVLDLVARIPRGKVMTYGDVAEYLGSGSARTVGMVMAKHGHEVCWHRVLRASGEPYDGGLELLVQEGVRVRGDRVVLADCRWDGTV
jgi:alkylated DNA nucleotide flippase Atl1